MLGEDMISCTLYVEAIGNQQYLMMVPYFFIASQIEKKIGVTEEVAPTGIVER